MTDKPEMPSMPKVDMDAMMAIQKANIETMTAIQKIMFDLTQAVAGRQADMFKEAFARTETIMKGFDQKKDPQAYVEEARAAFEKAFADVKETIDMGMKAQNEVVDLVVKRSQANIEDARKASE